MNQSEHKTDYGRTCGIKWSVLPVEMVQ